MRPTPPPGCTSHPIHRKSCWLHLPNKSTGYSLVRGKGKVLGVVTPLTKGSKLPSQMTEEQTSVAPWGDVLRTHHHACDSPAKDAQCKPNQREWSENSRLGDIPWNSWTLPNVNVMKNKEEQECCYRAGSANIFCKRSQNKYLDLWAIQTHLCSYRPNANKCVWLYSNKTLFMKTGSGPIAESCCRLKVTKEKW